MGLRAEKNILLYDKNKIIVITDLFVITTSTNKIPYDKFNPKKIKTLQEIENLLQCITNLKFF